MLGAARPGQQHVGALGKHQLGWDTGTGAFSAWWGENEIKFCKVLPAADVPFPGLGLGRVQIHVCPSDNTAAVLPAPLSSRGES